MHGLVYEPTTGEAKFLDIDFHSLMDGKTSLSMLLTFSQYPHSRRNIFVSKIVSHIINYLSSTDLKDIYDLYKPVGGVGQGGMM